LAVIVLLATFVIPSTKTPSGGLVAVVINTKELALPKQQPSHYESI